MKQHAIFPPSGAARGLACPASVMLNFTLPEETGPDAQEGILAHECAEKVLTGGSGVFEGDLSDFEAPVMAYVEYIQNLGGSLVGVEESIPIVNGCFGTIDALVWDPSEATLHIVDLKFGRRKVEAEGNPQLTLYAYGALMLHQPAERVKLHIVQPNLNEVSTAEYNDYEIINQVERWNPIIQQAIAGSREFHAGDHCRYCKAAPYCAERLRSLNIPESGLLSDEEMAALYPRLNEIKKWAEDTEKRMVEDAKNGKEYPGLVLFEKQGNRFIADPERLEEQLIHYGHSDIDIYENKLVALTKLAKAVGKDWAEVSEGCLERRPSTYTLIKDMSKEDFGL